MIVLFTDFGREGPYQALLQNAIHKVGPELKVIDLMADAPTFDPKASAYLLAALCKEFEPETVFLSVVDPGVGGARKPCIVKANQHWFVGPDNGLFDVVASRDKAARWWQIIWQPEQFSKTFHGRDLFAPVAANIALDAACVAKLAKLDDSPREPPSQSDYRVIYIDDYGNLITGIEASKLDIHSVLQITDTAVAYADTFSCVGRGQPLWFENAFGLVEIAINCGNAAKTFAVEIGSKIDEISTISS